MLESRDTHRAQKKNQEGILTEKTTNICYLKTFALLLEGCVCVCVDDEFFDFRKTLELCTIAMKMFYTGP